MTFIEAQTHRRFLKSHLPFDALPIYDEIQYVHVARHGLDAFMSWHNHNQPLFAARHRDAEQGRGSRTRRSRGPGRRTDPSPHVQFAVWMTEGPQARLVDDSPASHFFDIERSWWAERMRQNVLLVHYNDLKADLGGEMRRIASFLGIEMPESLWPGLVAAADFEFMREHGATLLPRAATSWDKGHERFINKGTNERWRDALTPADVARYQAREARECPPALARWLSGGRLVAGEPREAKD